MRTILQLRCAVIFAHGDHFTAGLDLVEFSNPKFLKGILVLKKGKLTLGVLEGRHRTKPVVVAVQFMG